jgi:hypothetical protein
MVRPLAAITPQTLNGITYVFDHWQHGGAASQSITITDNDATYIAVYRATSAPCERVTASTHDGNVPANVLDSNLNTRWSADGDGQWIQFCLNDTVTVTGVQAAFYNGTIRRATFDILTSNDGQNWTTAAAGLQSSGTTNSLQPFSITPRAAKYVRLVGHGNTQSTWNSFTEIRINTSSSPVTAIDHNELTGPLAKTTLNTYPNPFNSVNTITFSLKQAGHTRLAVFDMMGKQVALLINSNLTAGSHRIQFAAENLPAGVYTLKLVHGGATITRKVMKE